VYRREPRDLLSFEDFFLPFGGKLSGDNRWFKLDALIPWAEVGAFYCTDWAPDIVNSRREEQGLVSLQT
jgi:hypothetical protein